MYYGDFSDEADVLKEFEVDDFKGLIIFAVYDRDGYDGTAEVIFIEDGKIYMVHGSHCSCYGLEGDWNPIEMSVDGLHKIINKGTGLLSHYAQHIESALSVVEGMVGASELEQRIALKLIYG